MPVATKKPDLREQHFKDSGLTERQIDQAIKLHGYSPEAYEKFVQNNGLEEKISGKDLHGLVNDFYQATAETPHTETPEQEEHEKQTHSANHSGEMHMGEHDDKLKVDMLTDEMKADSNFQAVHQEVKQQKARTWEAKKAKLTKQWEKYNNTSINSLQGQEFLAKHSDNPDSYASMKEAEEKFRKDPRFKQVAKQYDRNELSRVTTNPSQDHVLKQFYTKAQHDANQEIQQGIYKKLQAGKINYQQFQQQSALIHDKHSYWQLHDFIKNKDYYAKANHYIQTGDKNLTYVARNMRRLQSQQQERQQFVQQFRSQGPQQKTPEQYLKELEQTVYQRPKPSEPTVYQKPKSQEPTIYQRPKPLEKTVYQRPRPQYQQQQQQKGLNPLQNLYQKVYDQTVGKLRDMVYDKISDWLSELFKKGTEEVAEKGVEAATQTGEAAFQAGETAFQTGETLVQTGEAATQAGEAITQTAEAAQTVTEVAEGAQAVAEGAEIAEGVTTAVEVGEATLTATEAALTATEVGVNVASEALAPESAGISLLIQAAIDLAIEIEKRYHVVEKVKKHPWILIFVFIQPIIIIFFFFFPAAALMTIFESIATTVTPEQAAQLEAEFNQGQLQPIPCLTLNVAGPDHVSNPTTSAPVHIHYIITITYCGNDKIQIFDPDPTNLAYLSGSNNPDLSTGSPTWDLDSLTPTKTDPTTNTRTYVITDDFNVLQNDVVVTNIVYAKDLSSQGRPVPGLTLSKVANPNPAQNGDKITYTITATYTGTNDTLTIFDKVPDNTSLVPGAQSPSGNFLNTNGVISWLWKNNKPASGNTQTFTFEVQPTQKDVAITNTVYATASGGGNIIWLSNSAPAEMAPDYWITGQCGMASLAEVLNYYSPVTNGVPQFTIHDVEQYAHDYNPQLWNNAAGLLWRPTPDATFTKLASHFNFKLQYINNGDNESSLRNVINIAQQTGPVIIGVQQIYGWGHYYVIWGADPNWDTEPDKAHIWALDSSAANFTYAPTMYPPNYSSKFTYSKKITMNELIDGIVPGGCDSYGVCRPYSEGWEPWSGAAFVVTP